MEKKVDFNILHALRAKLSKSLLEANTDDFFGDRWYIDVKIVPEVRRF